MSLVQIESPPSAESAVIHLHPTDNVAIARVMVKKLALRRDAPS